ICGRLSVSGMVTFVVNTTQGETLSTIGTAATTSQTRMCPANQMVVGFAFRSATLIDGLSFVCAPLVISGASPNFSLSVGSQTTLMTLGGSGGSPFPAISCPSGQVAVGDLGRGDGGIDAFGLLCSAPSLIVQ